MIIKGYLDFSGNSAGKGNEALYHSNFSSFAEGFTQGYLTMDAIAAIAFSMIVVNAVKLTGITKTNQIFKQTLTAGLIAAVALIFIYISLGYIGNHMPVSDMTLDQLKSKDRNNGRFINDNGFNRIWFIRKIFIGHHCGAGMSNYSMRAYCCSF